MRGLRVGFIYVFFFSISLCANTNFDSKNSKNIFSTRGFEKTSSISTEVVKPLLRSLAEEDVINFDHYLYTVAWQPLINDQDPLFRYLAFAGNNGTVSIYKYDCKNHKFNPSTAIDTYEFSADADAKIYDLRWDQNGDYLVVVGDSNNSGDCINVLLCEPTTKLLSKCDGAWSGNAADVVFAADWTYAYSMNIAVYGYDGSTRKIKIYDSETTD